MRVTSTSDPARSFDPIYSYILNRGWVDKSKKRVPTYHEITGDGKKRGKGKEKAAIPASESSDDEAERQGEEDEGLLSDASFESLASVFEVSYNHRFEEPGADTIPSFPRQIESTIRREENPRKAARERKRARKEEEMAKKREEVKRLKALKMKDIKRKLEKIGMESGLLKGSNKKGEDGDLDDALQELDLEGEWDPEKHDQQLQTLFAAEGDNGEEGDEMEDPNMRFDADGKPVWDDDIDLGDIPISDDDAVPVEKKSKKEKKKEKKKKKKKGGEDADEDMGVDVDAMDADRLAELNPGDDEEWDGTEEMRKRKWKEYMDSLYELDFNDMVRLFLGLSLAAGKPRPVLSRLATCLRDSNTSQLANRTTPLTLSKFSWPTTKTLTSTCPSKSTPPTVKKRAIGASGTSDSRINLRTSRRR